MAAAPSGPGHEPVLLDRVVALVAPSLDHDGAVLVDATLGLGGHSEAVLRHCPRARVVGLDRDPHALEISRHRLATAGERFTAVQAVYDEIPAVLGRLGLGPVDAALFDLGVSSMQLDVRERGFAYAQDAPLDMRMDDRGGRTAADVLNTYSVDELTRVLREYGEERYARRIARRIVEARAHEPFTRSARLVDLVRDAVPAPARRTGGNPAKRTFQALRIEVNDEIAVLGRALPAAVDTVRVGGRVVILAYQSLEDRLAKQLFARNARADVPPDLPVVPPEREPLLRLLTRGAERASPGEIARNPRAQSVRLRAVQRIRSGAVA